MSILGLFSFFVVPILMGDIMIDFMNMIDVMVMVMVTNTAEEGEGGGNNNNKYELNLFDKFIVMISIFPVIITMVKAVEKAVEKVDPETTTISNCLKYKS